MAKLSTAGRHFNWRNFWTTYFISYGQLAFGYPASIISVVLGNPAFQEYMGLVGPDGTATSKQNTIAGSTNGVFQAGAFVNGWLTAYVLEKFGRRNSVFYNAVLGLLGGALTTGAPNVGTFLAGRWFAGMSSWGFLILTPVYTAEMSPPDIRVFYTGLNGVHIGMGYLIAVCMGRAFIETPGNASWRAPLGIYLAIPLLMLVIAAFAPDSPRWLLIQGKTEKARDVLYKLHTIKGDRSFAEAEFEEMDKQIAIDRTLETSWISMFRKPSYSRRTLICMFYCFCGQSTAILVINNYGPTFYKALGYGVLTQFNFQVGWVALAPPFCLLGAILLDRIGRRILLLIGIGGCCLCLCVEAAAVAELAKRPTDDSLGKLGVAALYVFNACYNVGVDVGGNVFYAEVFPNHIRDKGVAITNAVLALADLVYLQVTALAFANIGYKYFLVFISITAVGFVILWFTLPETKGIPLEEMGKLFGDEKETMLYRDDADTERKDLERGERKFESTDGDGKAGDVEKGDTARHEVIA